MFLLLHRPLKAVWMFMAGMSSFVHFELNIRTSFFVQSEFLITPFSRVDFHKPKMLATQLHKLSQVKNTPHTNFIEFAKIVWSNF